MKIGQSLDSTYLSNSLLPRAEVPALSLDVDDPSGKRSSAPTVSTGSAAMPSSLSNTLWMMRAEQPGDVYLDPDAAKAEALSDSLAEQFSKWSEMTPAEKIRAKILEAHGLDEESLKSVSADLRKAIEEEIKQAIKDQLLPPDAADAAASGEAAAQAGSQTRG